MTATIETNTRQVRLTVTKLPCDDLNSICRTLDYAAKDIGVQVSTVRCEPERAHFEAQLEGQRADFAALQGILSNSFPAAEVELEDGDS